MKIGYARVSTEDQNLSLQLDALNKAGCEVIYQDHGVSGEKVSRPELDKMIARLAHGDVVVVWKVDRLGRMLKNLITLIDDFKKNGIGFQSVTEHIDTTSPIGTFHFQLNGAIAQLENGVRKERINAGIKSAKARGVHCGRSATYTADTIKTATRQTQWRWAKNEQRNKDAANNISA